MSDTKDGRTGNVIVLIGMLFFIGCCITTSGAALKASRNDQPVVAVLFGVGAVVCVLITGWFAINRYRHVRKG